jgi:hypothetical protein
MTDSRARSLLKALVVAQDAVESNRPLKPSLVAILISELIRVQRLLKMSEAKIRRLEGRDDMVMDGHRCAERSAPGAGDGVGRQAEDVDAE